MSITIETSRASGIDHEHLDLNREQLVLALDKLDGMQTTLLTLTVRGNELFIGGGGRGYTVTALMEDGESMALVGDPTSTGVVDMIVGGQQISQPARYLVNREKALQVATTFAEDGAPDANAEWEQP